MGVDHGFYMYDVVVKMFTFAILFTDEFLFISGVLPSQNKIKLF